MKQWFVFQLLDHLGKKKKKFEYVVVLSPFVVNVFQNKFTQNLKKFCSAVEAALFAVSCGEMCGLCCNLAFSNLFSQSRQT